MKVLVTGISGFAGSHIARKLVSAGFEVTGVYRNETDFFSQIKSLRGIKFERLDLRKVSKLSGPFSAIVHTAATSAAPRISGRKIVQDNIEGTLALLDAASGWGTERIVLFSSLSLYGEIAGEIVDEHTPVINPDVYGASKYICERLLAELTPNIPGLALRLPGIIGPGAHRNWLSSVIARIRKGLPVQAFNLESPFNNAVHINDVSDLVINLLNSTWRGFDSVVLGARGTLTIREIIERLGHALGVKVAIEVVPAAKPSYILSSERAIGRWGYAPMEIGAMIDLYGSECGLDRSGARDS